MAQSNPLGIDHHPIANTLALVMAGGCGTRLGPLTARRAKPAMPVAEDFHLIDFTLSNCVNSGLLRVAVLTQYLAGSLRPAITAWRDRVSACDFRVLSGSDRGAYTGTADAVWQNRDVIKTVAPPEVIILAADHIYAMDYGAMIEAHRSHRAPVTIGAVEVSCDQTRELGVMTVDREGYVRAFIEKPAHSPGGGNQPGGALASMGIYVFDTRFLLDTLAADAASAGSRHDFGHDVIPAVLSEGVYAYRLGGRGCSSPTGYWRDVGTLDAYWRANMELSGGQAPIDLHDPNWPFFGSLAAVRGRSLRWKTRNHGSARGYIGRDVTIVNSVVHPGVRIGPGSRIEECVVLPGVTIGANSVVRRAILDEGIWLEHDSIIGADPIADQRHHLVTRQGIVLVTDCPIPDQNPVHRTTHGATGHAGLYAQMPLA